MKQMAATSGRRNFILIFVINLLVSVSFHILNPTLPKYVVALGMTTAVAGVVSTAFVVTSLIVRPFAGRWSGTCDLRLLMDIGLGCLLVAIIGYAFSQNITMLILCRLIHGLGWGIATTIAATIAAASLPEKKLGSGIGIFGLASCISNAVAPNLGLALTDGGQYMPMFVVAACMPLCGIVLNHFMRLSTQGKKAMTKRAFRIADCFSVRCLIPMSMVLLLSISVASVSNFLALYAEDLQVAGIGMFFTLYAVALFVSKPLSGRAADHFGFGAVIYACAGLMLAAFVLICCAASLGTFLAAAVLYGIGYGGIQPALQAWSFKLETPERRGVASSTFFIGLDAGTGIGASVAGVAAQYFGYRNMYVAMLLPIILTAAVYAVSTWIHKKGANNATTV